MRVFWKYGYEGASLPALTRAMGINRPSMYGAFGNKESLFRKVIDRYETVAGAAVGEAMNQPTARAAVELLMRGTIGNCRPGRAGGCLLVQAALTCGDSADRIRRELAKRRGNVESALRERFERAIAEGEIPRKSNAVALAKFYATIQHGLAVQLASGADRDELLAAVDVAMNAFPPATDAGV